MLVSNPNPAIGVKKRLQTNPIFQNWGPRRMINTLHFNKTSLNLGLMGLPEGLVDRSEPAEEGTGREQQEPEQSQTKVHSVQRVCGEQGQSRENVQEQGDHAH